MFEKFPKHRIPLPEDLKKALFDYYMQNREAETPASKLSQKMESWMHRKVAADVKHSKNKSTLEIGAGTLNHLQYEDTQPYDVVEPYDEFLKVAKYKNKIRTIYDDIDDIDPSTRYDRITSIATFEHMLDLPKVIARACLLLNENGFLRIGIPNEGTILWSLGRTLTTGLEFRLKTGLDYGMIFKYEHVNSAGEIESILKYFFRSVKVSCFGLNRTFAFYRYLECWNPNIEAARAYLAQPNISAPEKAESH